MSSPEAAPGPGAGWCLEVGDHANSLVSDREDGLPGPAVTEAGGEVLCGGGGQEESPAELTSCQDFLPHPRVGDVANLEAPDNASELWAIRGDPEGGPSRTGVQVPSSASTSHTGEPEQDKTQKRGTTSRMTANDDAQSLSSEPESSDENSEVQTMRVIICLKNGGQAKSSGPSEPVDPNRHWNVQARESFVHMPSSLLTSTPRGLTSTSSMERQAPSREIETFPSKRKEGVVLGKGGSRPSLTGAASATVAGGLPKAGPRKKVAQKKKTLWDTSTVTLGRNFHQWGQRLKSAPADPATFPPISGAGVPGRANKCSLLPLGPKQCKNSHPGKRSVAKRTKEFQSVAREESDTARDPDAQAQLPSHRAEPTGMCVPQGEFSSGDPNTGAHHGPGNSQALALSQRDFILRVSAPSGDQEPPVPLDLEMQPPLGVEGCPRCQELKKEIDVLRKQLAAMQSLSAKFQTL